MNDSHARLQRTLRAIERGERLEAIDALLIRDVLQQPPPPRAHTTNDKIAETVEPTDVRGSDAYRVLLQLRRQRQLKAAEATASDASKVPSPVKPPVPASSPEKNRNSKNKHHSPRATVYVDKTTEDRQQLQREEALKLREEAGKVDAYRAEMAVSLAATQHQLERSQRDVAKAAQEMEALLAASQRVLSSSFLFERNLTEFCQERSLEVITGVLQRFQHRFYALVFAKWVDYTAQLRREEQRRAAATLVRVVRGHQARRLRRVLAREAAKLEQQARQVVELRVTYRHHQALKLQRVWRRYQWKQHDAARHRRKLAVLYLQQRWRDRKLRRNALVAALLNVKQIRAAIRVQCLARGWLTRRALVRQERERRRQAAAMALLERNTSREAMVRWQLARRGAAFVITRAMYPMLVRERFRRLAALLKRRRAARVIAVNVASWYKRSGKYQERQQASAADKLRTLLQQEQARQHAASVQIQSTMRRWWYQQQYETQRRRRVKLARLARLREKQVRLARKPEDRGGRGAAAAAAAASLVKASAGLADVLARQARKKAPSTQPQAVEIPSAAASKIQRAFRRHRYDVHARLQRWRRQAMDVEKRVRTRRRAATTIQRHARGLLARRVVREMRARHLLWKHVSRWKWRRASRRARAARRILRWLRGKRSQRLAALWTLEQQRRAAMATRLQRWLRRAFFYRKRVSTLLAAHRRRDEALLMATQSLVICSQHFTDDLVLQSKRAQSFDENIRLFVKGMSASTATPLVKPPARARFPLLPLVFLAVSGLKDPAKWSSVDIKELLLAKVERAKMVALFKAVNKLPTAAHSPQRRHHKPSDTFAMTDVDLAMAKAAGASKSALLFPEFAETLQHLADLKLAHVALWWNKFDGAEARLLALLWQFVLRVAELVPLADLLHAYVERVLGAHARVIQRLFLRQRDRAHGRLLRLQQQQQREVERRRAAIIKVQAHARRLLARGIYRARLQAQYDKYIDPEWGLPYWLNPRTGFSTWRKPWALGDLDVAHEAVPFPPADKTLTVGCQGDRDCTRCSDWYCYACDEFFCGECEPTFHKKKDGDHAMERLRKCGLCQFQVASRRCDGCADAVEKKKKKEKKESKKKPTSTTETEPPAHQEEDDDVSALYCDVCFAFAHRRGALQVHKSTPLVELCVDCQNDDTLLDAPKAPDVPKPAPRAVQWACAADGKRVCGVCAWSLHPVEACGELTRVPLVTVRMREHAEHLKREKEARDRADTELIRQRELRVRQERAAKKIQTFWRNSAPLIRARRVARALRAEKDAVWKQHQVDALEQKKLKYRVKNALGMARALPSDSAAQRKLREMNALQRRQMGLRARAFGLLLPEYMQLGVPLPGVARVTVGTKYIESSEDLRGWILNRQTIRLKKLPPKEQRDRARRLRFRHQEPPLEDRAWLHELELWMRDPTDTLLVDVDASQRITEHNIPLAAAFTTSPPAPVVPTKPTKSGAAPVVAEVAEPEEYAMFLVEFSMDPTRVVWVSHSLAERFTVWRKQKMREYRERRSLQHKTPDDGGSAVPSPALSPSPAPATSTNEEAVSQDQATEPVQYTHEYPADTGYASPDPNAAAWGTYAGYGAYDYSNYYGQTAWAGTASDPWSQYNNYSQSPAASTDASTPYYDYSNAASGGSYQSAFPAATTEDYSTPAVVDSSNYFYAEDGNAAAWQAYYASHPEMAASYDYSTPSGDASAYAGNDAAAYPATQDAWGSYNGDPYADPSTTYASTTDTTGYYASQPAQASPWEEVFDPATQQTYYYNRETQETSWAYPF